jgi:hypothetical protein
MEKSIFIGLGGSGVDTLAKIKYKIYKSIKSPQGDNRPHHEIINDDHRFLFIDTDRRDVNSNNSFYEGLYANNVVPLISDDEFIDIGAFNPKAIIENVIREKSNSKLLEAVNTIVYNKMATEPLRNGAGAFRLQGRTAFERKGMAFHDAVLHAIRDMRHIANNNPNLDFNFWVVSSSCGGTGSSILIDVLYMLTKAYKNLFPGNDPKIKLVLYMPKFYIDANSTNPNYPLNAHALFTELDLLVADRNDGQSNTSIMHRLNLLSEEEGIEGQFKPFSYCIPVDFYTEANNNFRNKTEMFQNTAEMIFYLFRGEGGQTIVARLVDSMTQTFTSINYLKYLIPSGYRALKKPEKEFNDYVEKRFMFELINYGLLGKKLSDVYPNERDLKKFCKEETNDKVFSRIFSANALTDIPNLENIILGQTEDIINDHFSHSLFFDAKGKLIKGQDANYIKQKFDETINDIDTTLKRNFEKKWKYEQAIGIRDRLWDMLEEFVLKFGLEFTEGLFYQIDLLCEEKVNEIGKSLESLNEVSQEDVKSVENKRQEFFNKPNQKNAGEYFKAKTKLLHNRRDVFKLNYQKELLKEICFRGLNRDDGIIDEMEMFIGDLKSHVTSLKVSAKKDLEGLAISFLALQRDVTTTYIPDISKFVDSGWTADNMFANLYHEIMAVSSKNDIEQGIGYRPLRNNSADIDSVEKKGLQKLMYEAIHLGGSYIARQYFDDSSKRIELFKIGRELNFSAEKILEDFIRLSKDRFMKLVDQNQRIRSQWFDLTITQLFNLLNSHQKRSIAEKFNSSGIQLFYSYAIDKTGNLDEKFVYVADNQTTAETILGYANRSNEQFVEDTQLKNTIYKIKISVSHAFSEYNFLNDIKDTYIRHRNNNSLYHHIHDWLNSSSVDLQQIRGMISKDEDSGANEVFIKYLFVNELIKKLESEGQTANIFFQPALASQRAKVSIYPLIIDANGANIKVSAAKATQAKDNKLYFEKDKMAIVYTGTNDYHKLYKAISQSADFHLFSNLITSLLKMQAIKQHVFPNFEEIRDAVAIELDRKWEDTYDQEEKKFLEMIIEEVTNLKVGKL